MELALALRKNRLQQRRRSGGFSHCLPATHFPSSRRSGVPDSIPDDPVRSFMSRVGLTAKLRSGTLLLARACAERGKCQLQRAQTSD
jgi:hypothetical protein